MSPQRYEICQLHRNFGKLHTAQNKLVEALDDLSKDIYCSSLEVGPEHIDTSAGYFLVANIFYAQRKVNERRMQHPRVLGVFAVDFRGCQMISHTHILQAHLERLRFHRR